MASNQKTIYVYESFQSTEPNFLGTLFVENVRGRESYSFEYDADWLKSSANYMYLDPDLQLYAGRQYPTGAKNVFGLFADSSPDRWGRLLMTRRERILAEQEGRKPRKLLDSDFLMGVYDETRMGAIRFKLDKDGPFLSDDSETPTPPWTSLRTLEEASRQFENDESGLEQKWINQLIKPGSSLGGARPKATVLDTKGNLWIAKFPSKHDDINVGAWEKVTHDLARLCGLDVPESMLIDFSILKGFAELTGAKLTVRQDHFHDITATFTGRCGFDITATQKRMRMAMAAADHISVNRWSGSNEVEFSLIFGFSETEE